MDPVEVRVRREQRGAWIGAAGTAAFSAIAVPLVLADGARRGGMVGLAPSLAVACVWIFLTTIGVMHARRWAALPRSAEGLRVGLEAARSLDGRRPLGGLIAFFVAWAPIKLSADWTMYTAEPWRAVLGFGGFLVLAGGLWWVFRRGAVSLERQIAAVG